MSPEQYHEPASALSQATRTLARMAASLQDEGEAIGAMTASWGGTVVGFLIA
jgi:hypothetical protein